MKILTSYLFVVFVICLSTCKKGASLIVDIPDDPVDTIIPPPVDTHIIALGKVSVLKNGVEWDAPFKALYSHSDSAFVIFGSIMNYSNGVNQKFRMDDIPCKRGKYIFEFWPSQGALYPDQIPQGSFGMIYDGDQPIGSFFLDTLRNDHFIEILQYDTIANIAEGRFQIFLKKDIWGSGWQPPGITVPDSIAMTEGRFRLEVKHF